MLYDVIVIGCGVVGAAMAYELGKRNLHTLVLEADIEVGAGQTKANSAILHAGYDPKPGTRMAKLNVEGVALAKEICETLGVARRACGALVLAFNTADEEMLAQLYQNGVANGVPGLQIISGDAAREKEPNLSAEATAALYAPSAAVVCPMNYTHAMIENAVDNGVTLCRQSRVTGIEATAEGYRVFCGETAYDTKTVVNAAGIHSAEIHNMIAPPSFAMQPSSGSYYLLDTREGARVNSVVFQCPSAEGKGVLVAPTVHGNLIVGPDARAVEMDDAGVTAQSLTLVKQQAQKSVPSIDFRMNIRNFAGVRANTDREDFIIEMPKNGFVDLAGIKSPGLSAAPAIAREALALLTQAGLSMAQNTAWRAVRRGAPFAYLPRAEQAALIAQTRAYGNVVCRCYAITEGEIVAALHESVPPLSLDGVKRRLGAGMGRCQGTFCGPKIVEIMARELSVSPLEITQSGAGTAVLTRATKQGGHADV